MAELLTFAGVRKDRGRLYGPTDLVPFVEEWSVSGLLIPVRDGFHGLYRLPPVLFHPLFALLRERGQLRRRDRGVQAGRAPARDQAGQPARQEEDDDEHHEDPGQQYDYLSDVTAVEYRDMEMPLERVSCPASPRALATNAKSS